MFRAGIFCGIPFGNAATRERSRCERENKSGALAERPDAAGSESKMRVGSVRFGFCGAVRFKEE